MKKRYFLAFAMVGLVTISGCSKKVEYSIDQIGINIELSEPWLNKVDYSSTAINEYAETSDHFRVYLPQDVSSSLRLNVLDLESTITDKFVSVSVPYATGTNFTEAARASLAVIYSSHFSGDNKLQLAYETNIPASWSTRLVLEDSNSEAVEGKSRALYTVYMPTYVEHYGSYDGSIKIDCKSYVLVPISFGIVYSSSTVVSSSNLEGVDDSIKAIESVTFNVTNGLLA